MTVVMAITTIMKTKKDAFERDCRATITTLGRWVGRSLDTDTDINIDIDRWIKIDLDRCRKIEIKTDIGKISRKIFMGGEVLYTLPTTPVCNGIDGF